MFTFLIFLLSGVLYFPPAYGGPESLGARPSSAPRQSVEVIHSEERNGR